MNYNYLKKLSIVALSLMTSAMSMMAANTLSVGGFSISDKQEHQLTIDLNSDGKVSVMQFEITLPAGLSLTKNFAKTNALGDGYQVSQTAFENNSQKYLVVVANPNLEAIAEGEKSILTFSVTADESYVPNGSTIKIENVKGANAEGTSEEVTLGQNGEFINQSAGSVSGSIDIPEGSSDVVVTLKLQNNIDFLHLGATINLPAGIDIGNGDITPNDGITIQWDKIEGKNAYSIILGTGYEPMTQNFGDAISFKLVANSDFDGNACQITVTDINASDENATSYDLDMVEIDINENMAGMLKNAALIQAKADAIKAVEAAAAATKNEGEAEIADNIQHVVTSAEASIEAATSVEGVNSTKTWATELIANLDLYNEYIDQLKSDLDNAVQKDADGIIMEPDNYLDIVNNAKAKLEGAKEQYNNSEGQTIDTNKATVKAIYDKAVDDLAANRLTEYASFKEDVKKLIETYRLLEGNDTEAIVALLDAADTAVDQKVYNTEKTYIENVREVKAITDQLDEDIKAIKDAAALADAKEKAKEDIDFLAGENPSAEIAKAVQDAKDAIDAAKNQLEVIDAKSNGVNEILRLQELAAAKAAAKTEIAGYIVSTPSEEMQAIIDDINGDIDAAETSEAIAEVVAAGKAKIDAQKQKEEQAAALAQAKTEAIAAIDGKVKELYPNNDAPESVTAAASAAKTAINEAQTSEAVATAQQNGIAAINAAATLESYKAAAITEIENVVANIAGEGEAPEAVTAAATTAKDNIAKAIDNAGVDKAKQDGLDAIQLILDKATFDAHKAEVQKSISGLQESEMDAEGVADLITAAETALEKLVYDEEKSLDKNMQAIDAIKTQLVENIHTARANSIKTIKATVKQMIEAKKKDAPEADDLIELYDVISEEIDNFKYDREKTWNEQNSALWAYDAQYGAAIEKYIATHDFTFADINEDGEVDIYDYAKLAYFIMHDVDPSKTLVERFGVTAESEEDDPEIEAERLFNLYDVNADSSIDVVDLPALVNEIFRVTTGQVPETTGAKGKVAGTATISTEVVGNDLIFNLTNSAQLVAIQMDVTISGAEVMAEQLSRRAGAHELMIRNIGGDKYRIMIVGTANEMFEGGKGELFRLSLNGVANNVEFGKIVAADARANSYAVAVGGTVTGVNAIDAESAAVKSYTIGGQQQNSVKAGLNIVVGADGKARKVLK